VHALSVLLASAFAFFASFAVLGSLSAILPREAFRACSSWVRGILLVGSLCCFSPASRARTWFTVWNWRPIRPCAGCPRSGTGVYQSLQHRAGPALAGLASTGVKAAAAAFALMALTYAIGYRRRFAGVLEGGGALRAAPVRAGLRFLDLFSPRTAGFERACHGFVVRALLRNEAHRLVIAVSIGLDGCCVSDGIRRPGIVRPHPPLRCSKPR